MEKLKNIGAECSDMESDATNWEPSSENESDYVQSETSDAENSGGVPRRRCRMLKLETPFRKPNQLSMVLWGGKIAESGIPGRSPSTSVFKGVKGPACYAKMNIMADNLVSAFSLIIDNYIIKQI